MAGRRLFHLPGRVIPVPLSTPVPDETHTYRIVVARVVDGDTLIADLLLGYGGLSAANRRMRLAGCNAWERNTLAGAAAATHLVDRLPAGIEATVRVVSETVDPHGRLLVTVRLDDGVDLVEELIAQQWAARWDGRGVAPVPPWPRTVTS